MQEIRKNYGWKEFFNLLKLAHTENRRCKHNNNMSGFLVIGIALLVCFILSPLLVYFFISTKLPLQFSNGVPSVNLFFLTLALLLSFVGVIFTYDIEKLKYVYNYTQTAWWRNTHILPSRILSDSGIMGEFLTTMSIETYLKKYNIYGRILNGVIVPKRDGDFVEIDIVVLSSYGIQCIEVKNWSGIIDINVNEEVCFQSIGSQKNEHYNPILQNQSHCNYLGEYIAENIPSIAHKRIGNTEHSIMEYLYNVIFFSNSLTCLLQMHPNSAKIENLLVVNKASYDRNNFFENSTNFLSEMDINIAYYDLCKLIYTDQEKDMMMQRRRVRQNLKVGYGKKITYSVMRIAEVNQAIEKGRESAFFRTKITVCRDDGYYKTYLSTISGLYFAEPSAGVLTEYGHFNNEQEAINLLYQIINQHGNM